MNTAAIRTEDAPVALGESRALVERVAASAQLKRAARLRAFLIYVCDQALNHGVTVIHEQEIGIALFGRSPGYDTSIDNIVRVNATELRKRLEHYFAEEGAQEELVLEIQRGSYAPAFRRRSLAPPPATAAVQPSGKQPPPGAAVPAESGASASVSDSVDPPPAQAAPAALASTRQQVSPEHGRSLGWSSILVLLLLAGCAYLAWQLHLTSLKIEPWRSQASLRSFWSNFFESGTQTDILLADTSFALAQDIMQRPVSLPDYLDYKYKQFAEDPALTPGQRRDLMLVLERNNGSIADFRVAQQVLSLNPTNSTRPTLQFAREYTPDAAKRDSLVLIGSRQSNPWVGLFAGKLNFDLTYDVVNGHASILNRSPRPGESPAYPASPAADPPGTGYAVIAFLPGLNEQARTLIIEGTDSQATGAAGDYITDEDSMRALQQRFPDGKVSYFEVVMRTSQLSGTPLHGEVIAFRPYSRH